MTTSVLAVRKNVSKSIDKIEKTLSGSFVFVTIIVLTALLFGVNLFLTYLAGNPDISKGLFIRGISEVSSEYPLNITPAGFTFSIWGVIYLLQTGWILYSLGLLCRSTPDGAPAYLNPPVLSPAFFLYFNASTLAVSAWLFMWDRLYFLAAFVFLVIVATCLVMAVVCAASNLNRYHAELVDQGRSLDVKVLTVTVVNGISMYATWTVVATLINVGIIVVYKVHTPLTNESASCVCIGILALILGFYTVTDFMFLKEITRFNLAPYLTIIWAAFGIIMKNIKFNKDSTFFTLGLMIVTGAVLTVKVIHAVVMRGRYNYAYSQMKFGRCVTPTLDSK